MTDIGLTMNTAEVVIIMHKYLCDNNPKSGPPSGTVLTVHTHCKFILEF